MRTHKDLDVWKSSIYLAGNVYKITEKFPKNESFGITSQMRRAAVSVGANIAEGAARQSKKEFIRFLSISKGSASELDTLLEISKVTRLLKQGDFTALQADVVQDIKNVTRAHT